MKFDNKKMNDEFCKTEEEKEKLAIKRISDAIMGCSILLSTIMVFGFIKFF